MKVKALCGVIYKGELHKAGELFDADTILPNTEPIIIKSETRVSSEIETEDTEKSERLSEGKQTRKRR